MKIDNFNNEEVSKVQKKLNERLKEERLAAATLTSETLSRLNVSIAALPQRCQQLLLQTSTLQEAMDVENLDPVVISLRQSEVIAEVMSDECELLELRHKNAELQRKIDRNQKFIDDFKKELQSSKDSLANQTPNPDNIQEHMRQVKQKFASYEEVYEKAKSKFTRLHVPDSVLPSSIEELASKLATLKEEAEELRQRAEDITLARQAMETLHMLRRQ